MNSNKMIEKILTSAPSVKTGVRIAPEAKTVAAPAAGRPKASGARPEEFGGQKGPEPTRYGDWESKGRCSDF